MRGVRWPAACTALQWGLQPHSSHLTCAWVWQLQQLEPWMGLQVSISRSLCLACETVVHNTQLVSAPIADKEGQTDNSRSQNQPLRSRMRLLLCAALVAVILMVIQGAAFEFFLLQKEKGVAANSLIFY